MKKHLAKISSLLLLFMVFSSCSNKAYKLQKQGKFTEATFSEEISFRYLDHLILVDIQIEDRTYTCILDTGAEISVFDSKLFDKISHKEVANQKVSGAAGVKNNFKFLEIPKVSIGNLDFLDLVAISADLSPLVDRLKCAGTIHGLIGSNMMRKAKWRIDYQQQKIWMSDKLSSFDDLQDDIIINLECGKVGSAYINTTLNGIEESYTFDTGKAGGIQSNIKVFDQLLEANKDLEYTQAKGITGITLNGIQYGTTNYTLISETNIGEIVLNNQIIEIRNSPKSSSLMGNEIWENYSVTIDWENCNLYLNPNQKIKNDPFYRFEYNISTSDTGYGFKLINQWLQHPSKFDIDNNNEITHIEGLNVLNLNQEEYCDFLENKIPLFKEQDTISIIVLENGKEKKITLNRAKLLPK